MKKNILLQLVLIHFFYVLSAQAQDKKNNEIVVSGYVSDEVIKSFTREMIVRFYDKFNPMTPTAAEILPITIENNRFSVTLHPTGEAAYFEFRAKHIPSLFLDYFLVQPGDSVVLHLENVKSAYFTGRGAEKLNYQIYGGKVQNYGFKTFFTNNNESRPYYEQKANNNWKLATDSLNKIRLILPDKIYRVLHLATFAAISHDLLGRVRAGFDSADSVNSVAVLDMLRSMNRQQSGNQINDPFILDNTGSYIHYLFDFQNTYHKLLSGNFFNKISPELVYNSIIEQYNGILRDKLIAECFLTYKQNAEVMARLPEALALVKDALSLEILKQFSTARAKGAKAYAFTFETADGKKITLEDFKGKVIVIDTWFRGCTGCISLAAKLEPVMKHYKKKDVVFLSINVDPKKSQFIEGVKSGQYGNNQSIYAYTGGKGANDPFLIHYQYTAFPNLLIIDKTGNVVAANPPLPRDEKGKMELYKLIDEHL